jgi:hypothetical protein
MTFDDQIKIVLPFAAKLKAVMLNRKLQIARTNCPKCDGIVRASLQGKKNHIHLKCEKCDVMLME